MLRTNLSTRPFYNDRAVRIGLLGAVLLIAALTTFNVLQVMSLNSRNSEVTARAALAEADTARLRQQARDITRALDNAEVTAVQDAAREANLLIERRAFSWTELFNRFETTLPADVRIAAVEPQIDREGRLLIMISTISRSVEDLHVFIDQLEAGAGMREVIPRSDEILDDGMLRAVIQGYYDPLMVSEAATPPAGASEPSVSSHNGSPADPPPSAAPAGRRPQGGGRGASR